MLKKSIVIILTALMLCATAACQKANNGEGTAEASIVVSETSEASKSESEWVNPFENTSSDSTETSNNQSSSQTPSQELSGENEAAPSDVPPEMPEGMPEPPADNGQGDFRQHGNNMMPQDQSGTAENSGKISNNFNPQGNTAVTPDTGTSSSKATAEELKSSEIFTERDLAQTADVSSAVTITAQDGKTETITTAGVYIISGTASEFTVKVQADKEDKVQLVLDGLNVTNSNFPVIYVSSADKCFITTTNSTNTLSVTGTFRSDGDTNTDAVIYSKDDLVFNGVGTLNISSSAGNGISGKDDVKFTGGTYSITSKEDSIEANDSISVYDGTFTIKSSKDGLHSEDSDDNTVGYIYIANGTFHITASSDAIQGTTLTQIDGGTFEITSSEGIEATYVRINGGNISISASDDGINATTKSTSYSTPTVEFNGGTTKIVMGQGDTDAVDANGNIIVNGGTIDITATVSSFDYDGTAEYNGGTIIINGTQVDSIPQSMMGGRGGMGGMGGRGNMGGMNPGGF